VSVPALSDKDIEDLRFALALGVDFIALSFVRSAADAEDVRVIMRPRRAGAPGHREDREAAGGRCLDEIVEAFDGIMVARGDLGVECPLEEVPFMQKRIIDKARQNAKPVIVATQMLESMIESRRRPAPRPPTSPTPSRRRRRGHALGRDQRG
jgi:pyruvate kinase